MDTTQPSQSKPSDAWPVMVLAYNEEEGIAAALDSIFASEPGQKFEVYVMANGCTDRTEDIVRAYGKQRPEVHLVSIKLGDKCNAWNVFIQETVPTFCPGRDVYFFTCGDVTIVPGSLSALARALREDPYPHAASAPPGSGRNVERDRQGLIEDHAIVAGLYALRGSFVARLKALGVRIPLNFEGDDALIGTLVKWDLAPSPREMDALRVKPVEDSAWIFDSLSLLRWDDWRFYWKRAVRYARRYYEFKLLGPELKSKGLAGLPRDIQDLYPGAKMLALRWQGIYTITNWIALRRMRRIGEARRA
ncbi:MAG: glycosyltransferase [Proteobacteria bacterium]|nr:glycosyltransferase [Pseudomonadota bacterium]